MSMEQLNKLITELIEVWLVGLLSKKPMGEKKDTPRSNLGGDLFGVIPFFCGKL